MKKLDKKDEIIIQNKIDGTLSAQEEERFNELISTSSGARALYQSLLNLHFSLKHDAKEIPPVDISPEVVRTVETKRIPAGRGRTALSVVSSKDRFLAYAAILLTGLFIGSFLTYLASSPKETVDETVISGTMADVSGNKGYFHDEDTEIKIQEFESGEFNLLLIGVNTRDTISCTIPFAGEKPADQHVIRVFSSDKSLLEKVNDGKPAYLFSGNHVFYLNKNIIFNTEIQFANKSKIIYTFNLDRR